MHAAFRMLALTILCSIPVNAVSQNMHFHNLSVEDGLTQSTVYAILQDKEGFMWFGTRDGLNRYDGTRIISYRTQPGKSFTLSHPNIRALTEDDNGMLWIGTDGGGLNRFNTDSGKFYNYTFLSTVETENQEHPDDNPALKQILSLAIDYEGLIWVGHRHYGVSLFDPARETFRLFGEDLSEPAPQGSVWALEVDNEGVVWIGTEHGLWRYVGGSFFELVLPEEPIWSVYSDDDGIIWVGTSTRGVLKIDPESNKTQRISSSNPTLKNLMKGNIGPIILDNRGRKWIAHADFGLFIWNPRNDEVWHIYSGSGLDNSIRDNSIRQLYKDRTGMIWVGTNAAGVYSYSSVRKKFERFPSSEHQRRVLSSPIILSFTEDPDGNIWVGTENAGVYLFNREQNSFEALPYDPGNPEKLNHHQIVTLLTDRKGSIWIGTDGGGLERWSADGTKLSHYVHNPEDEESISNDSILFLYEDSAGRIWAGTYRGLSMKKPDSDSFMRFTSEPGNGKPLLSDERVLSIYEDRKGLIWIGTHGGGLNKLDPEVGTIKSYTPYDETPTAISSDRVNAIIEDDDGRLWLGTYHGLNAFNPETETFIHFTETDGLASNIVRGIIRNRNDLWLSTNNGLSRFNIQTSAVDNFTVNDGLQSSEFKGGAYFKSSSGELYFGGINGFNVFKPDRLPMNLNMPPVVLTDFSVSGVRRDIIDGKVNLRYIESFFTIHFAALDFVSPADNRYRYKLTGFDHDWIDAGNQNEARYTSVPPGEYEFRVVAANNDGVWNTEGAVLFITIIPPFWSTWWFITLIIMSMLLLLFIIFRVRSNLKLREEQLRQKIARNLHDDISGSLSSIDLFATAIKREKFNERKSADYLQLITESAKEAKGKISEIIWYVDPRYDDWHSFASHLHRYADNMLEAASVACRVRIRGLPDESMSLEVRQNLWLVTKELLTNIIRHSQATEININLAGRDKKITIEIQDNGKGFDKHADRKGNGIDNVIQRCNSIGAEVKLETSPGNGTRWEISFSA